MAASDQEEFLDLVLSNPVVETVLGRVACCVGVRREPDGSHTVHAPFGFDDLFRLVLTPNPVLAPQEVYATKAARWQSLWPRLVTLPWPSAPPD